VGAESNMRGRVCEALRVLHAVAIENSVDAGTPDVNCSAGWIELKQLPLWPARPETHVRIPKFRPEQRLWLQNRCEKGGTAWLLLRVENEWLLFWGAWAARHINSCTKKQLIEGAVAYWPNGLDGNALARTLVKATWSHH
jgi:hypothetical protein